MEKVLLEILDRMTKEKILKKRFPTYVLYLELKKELGDEIGKDLKKLAKAGRIKTGQTLNDKFIKLN